LGIVIFGPFGLLLGAQLWQLQPATWLPYAAPYRFLAIGFTLIASCVMGVAVGPALAQLLFGGDIPRWLDGQTGSALGGWLVLWLPVSAVLAFVACGSFVNPWMRRHWGSMPRGKFAVLNLLKFVFGSLAAVGMAWGIGAILVGLGLDPRGSIVDTYVQRNALIVGFVMGFAIIPLIFTIADDALSTVPQHLRSASLGAGATPWQTAVRVVIPTAMSGLFSAVMIGLGRAVGETMIVLMAGGNTPIMQWNMFNGVRTLSANIAVELPEAVRDSSHYRTLFLAALVLFVLTFVVNTAAELVRIRFRKRAYQL
jgi:phosphate transport system permease protein